MRSLALTLALLAGCIGPRVDRAPTSITIGLAARTHAREAMQRSVDAPVEIIALPTGQWRVTGTASGTRWSAVIVQRGGELVTEKFVVDEK